MFKRHPPDASALPLISSCTTVLTSSRGLTLSRVVRPITEASGEQLKDVNTQAGN